MVEVSLIVPIYNEESNINLFYARALPILQIIAGYSYEIIFVNDGSKDSSFKLIKELSQKDTKVKYINFSRNFGHQIAVTAGIENASGNAIVIIDADLQDPPELIPELYDKLKSGFDVVYAKRTERKGESLIKKSTAKFFYRILARITSISIPLDTGDFRIVNRKVVDVLNNMPEQHKFLRGQISWIGFKQTYVEYTRQARNGGESGYPLKKMVRFALDGITSFSDFPLRFASLAGFFVSGISFIIMLYALYARFVSKDYIQGWTSLMLVILFIGGIQLICIGIIGEYISRILSNSQKRPLYVVEETNITRK